MENQAESLEAEHLEAFERHKKERAKWLAGLSEKEKRKYLVTLERDHKQMQMGSVIRDLIQNYDTEDLLTHELIGTLLRLGNICIDWFPSKSADSLLEELFKPIFNNVTP